MNQEPSSMNQFPDFPLKLPHSSLSSLQALYSEARTFPQNTCISSLLSKTIVFQGLVNITIISTFQICKCISGLGEYYYIISAFKE